MEILKDRKIIYTALAVFLLIILTLVLIYIFRPAPSLTITSKPSKIDVYINNIYYQTPVTINTLKIGSYTIYGSQAGYQVYQQNIKLKSGSNKLEINLTPETDVPKEGAPEEDANSTKLLKILTDTSHFSVQLSSEVNSDIEIKIFAILNGSTNPETDKALLDTYNQELKQYKQESLAWIKSQGIDPNNLRIKWLPTEAANL